MNDEERRKVRGKLGLPSFIAGRGPSSIALAVAIVVVGVVLLVLALR